MSKELAALAAAVETQAGAITKWNDNQKTANDNLTKAVEALEKRSDLMEVAFNRSPRFNLDDGIMPEDKAATAAFETFVRKGDETEIRALMVGDDPSGGYTVSPEVSNSIDKLMADVSPFRSLARVRTTGTDAVEQLQDRSTAGAEWVGETQSRGETTNPKLSKQTIFNHELHAQVPATTKLLDDSSISVESWIADSVADQFSVSEGDSFLNGDGVAKPRGVMTYPTDTNIDSARDWGTLQHTVSGDANLITSDSLLNMLYSLKSGYRVGAVWAFNSLTALSLRKLKDGDGRYLWSGNGSLNDGQPASLLGYRVAIMEDLPDVAAGIEPVLFGDFRRAYTIVDRMGVRMLRDPYSNKPHVIFDFTKRVGGEVTDFNAMKVLTISS